MKKRSDWCVILAFGLLASLLGCDTSSTQQSALSTLKQSAKAEGRFDQTGQLRELNIFAFTKNHGAQLAQFPQLEKLTLSGDFGSEALAELPEFPNLKTLVLDGSRVADSDLDHLAKFTQLRELSLEGCRITDEGLKSLGTFQELRHLNLNRTQITGAGLAQLTGLERLEYLSMQETPLDFANCSSLKGLIHLKTLHVANTPVDGKIINVLPDLPALERLYLEDTKISDQDLPKLAIALAEHSPKLKGLFVDRTQISDASVDSFKPLAKLSELSLVHIMNTRISFDGHVKLRGILPDVNLMSTH